MKPPVNKRILVQLTGTIKIKIPNKPYAIKFWKGRYPQFQIIKK